MKKASTFICLFYVAWAMSQTANWQEQGTTAYRSADNVVVGVSDSQNAKLSIDGDLHTKEVKIDITNWPDYVFEAGYNLATPEEVAQHLKEKGHLINFPSAEELETNGLDLGEMNRLLLEKVEELTLYTLQLRQEYNENNKRLQSLLNTIELEETND